MKLRSSARPLSHDLENDPDIVAMIGASAALTLSGIPFMGPVGAARVGYIDGEFVLNPSSSELEDSDLDLVVAGTSEGVLMVESEAKELSEDIMLAAVTFGHKAYQEVIAAIIDLAEEAAKEAWEPPVSDPQVALVRGKLASLIGAEVRAAYQITQKTERHEKLSRAKSHAIEILTAQELPESLIANEFKELEKTIVREAISNNRQAD